MIYKLILMSSNKRNKLSLIHLFLGGFAKVCFGYIQVIANGRTTVTTTTDRPKI